MKISHFHTNDGAIVHTHTHKLAMVKLKLIHIARSPFAVHPFSKWTLLIETHLKYNMRVLLSVGIVIYAPQIPNIVRRIQWRDKMRWLV